MEAGYEIRRDQSQDVSFSDFEQNMNRWFFIYLEVVIEFHKRGVRRPFLTSVMDADFLFLVITKMFLAADPHFNIEYGRHYDHWSPLVM